MKKNILIALFLFLNLNLYLNLTSCNTTEPKLEPEFLLKLEDVSCTEAWLQLTTNNIQLPATINLLKNNVLSKIYILNTQDSLLYIDSLLTNQTYKIQVAIQQSNNASNELSVTTMDTTSHNFTWQTFEFGVVTNQSHLFDVTIINENNIWAVGEIYMNDSLGNPDPNSYNAVHWNGQSWELKRIMFYTFCPQGTGEGSYPAQAIFALDDENLVISSGSQIAYLKNGAQTRKECVPVSVIKIWGSSVNDFYIVGYGGGVAHYTNGSWTKIESGTNMSLSDITNNNLDEIFICGGNPAYGQGIILKSSNGNNFSTFVEGANIPESQLFNPKLYGSFSSIWIDPNNTLYSGGNILFQNKFNKWSYVKSLPENFIGGNTGVYYRGYITKVRGNEPNDMWIVGDRNTLRHFNGVSWQQIGMPYDPNIDLVWRGMAGKDDKTIIVGTHNRNAIIMMIKK